MNLIEISDKFPNERAAVIHFERARWGKKVKCAYCNSPKTVGHDSEHRHKCYDCRKTFSVTVGTYLHHTRVPLKTWLYAFSVITDAKKGVSALQLQRHIEVDYKTALNMYRITRSLMELETNKPNQLEGIVEMDETYIGGKPRRGNKNIKRGYKYDTSELDKEIAVLKAKGVNFKRKKGNPAKPSIGHKSGMGTDNIPVVGIVQRDGDVVAEVMPHVKADYVREMVKEYVKETKSTLVSDSSLYYTKMDKIIDHIAINHKQMYSYKGVNTNSIESFWAIVKRGISGTYHHVSERHLPEYITEFVFKYNNRKDDTMFETLVTNAVKEK